MSEHTPEEIEVLIRRRREADTRSINRIYQQRILAQEKRYAKIVITVCSGFMEAQETTRITITPKGISYRFKPMKRDPDIRPARSWKLEMKDGAYDQKYTELCVAVAKVFSRYFPEVDDDFGISISVHTTTGDVVTKGITGLGTKIPEVFEIVDAMLPGKILENIPKPQSHSDVCYDNN